ncbi:MAG: tRNA (adenosine(37)-N6)-threonylcarbamoyltransferase complex ATPase subunit type 1 TsaE [Flavobacteriaceae bacterium]|nr:tRNA (adenosine(37)-N6)-threonylcarbamoyltransferase complex ATPase subunit type 1 TsaE [Flavobacteriaceae bacterium]|tara:strand:+ start:76 stop:483 length:408 start_codon:yes stop_codon:yes gene_type:complete
MEKTYSLSEINEIAIKICNSLKHSVTAFNGPMGAGKTTLIKAICKNLKFNETITSPTFSLVNTYVNESKEIIHHFDFYRIESIDEALDIGVEEYFESENKCFIEWPEKILPLLKFPLNNISIDIISENKRTIKFL